MGVKTVSHCFPVNGNPNHPEVAFGVSAVLETYRSKIYEIGLGSPTLFTPLLKEFKTLVTSLKNSGKMVYPVLLILTDGTIDDKKQAKDEIYDLSFLPCSIIIVGVGTSDFSAMVELDGDSGRLTNSKNESCNRDIVQFVEFNEAMRRGDLAEQILKEIPNQLVTFVESTNFSFEPLDLDVDMSRV